MHGSILVEAVLALSFIILPGMALQLELVRGVLNRAILHAAAFQYARHRGLGSEKRTALLATKNLTRLLLSSERRQAGSLLHWEDGIYPSRQQVWSRVRVRYPTFFPFLKDRSQVTETCRFSW